MFINKLVRFLWKDNSIMYNQFYEFAMNLNLEKLYEKIIDSIDRDNFKEEHGLGFYVVFLNTMGCTYCYRNNSYMGCSMCNWSSELIEFNAYVNVLRKRDETLYNEMLIKGFEHFRSLPIKGLFAEEYVIHDSFDCWQIPDSFFDLVSGKNSIYSKQPSIGILQARANNINLDRILQWKKVFTKGINISLGVETHNEWLRNHWLNKSITNIQICDSFSLLKQNGIKTSANIIFGMPGFSERQSILTFVDSIEWLNKNPNIDMITISPLIDKSFTLQNLINEIYKENTLSIISFFIALSIIIRRFEGIENKLVLSPENTKTFFSSFKRKSQEETLCIEFILSVMQMGSYNGLLEITKYDEIVDKAIRRIFKNESQQIITKEISSTLLRRVENIVDYLNDDNLKNTLIDFKTELDGFEYE